MCARACVYVCMCVSVCVHLYTYAYVNTAYTHIHTHTHTHTQRLIRMVHAYIGDAQARWRKVAYKWGEVDRQHAGKQVMMMMFITIFAGD